MFSVARPWSFLAVAVVLASFASAFVTPAGADEKEAALKAFSIFVGKWDTGYVCTATKGGRFVFQNSDQGVVSIIGWDTGEQGLMACGFDDSGKHWVDKISVLDGGKFRIERLHGVTAEHPVAITFHGDDTFDWVAANGETTRISRVKGDAAQASAHDDFEKLKGILGKWEATLESQGTTQVVPVSWELVLGGKFIEHKYKFVDSERNVTIWGIVIFGRDPGDGKIRGWGFDNQGGFMGMTLNGWEGNKSSWSTTFVANDGAAAKTQANTFEVLDDNSYGWMIAIEGGARDEAVFKRASLKADTWPKPQLAMPANAKEQLKKIGWWVAEGTIRGRDAFSGQNFVGQSTCTWAVDGQFLQYDSATVDTHLTCGYYRAFIGVDPSTNKITGWEFDSTGAVGKYVVSEDGKIVAGKATSPEFGVLDFRGEMSKVDNGIEYRATGTLPGNKKSDYHFTVTTAADK